MQEAAREDVQHEDIDNDDDDGFLLDLPTAPDPGDELAGLELDDEDDDEIGDLLELDDLPDMAADSGPEPGMDLSVDGSAWRRRARMILGPLDRKLSGWLGGQPADEAELREGAAALAECLAITFQRIDPNNPWGALLLWAGMRYGFMVPGAVRAAMDGPEPDPELEAAA